MQTTSFADSGPARPGVASAAWGKKSQLMKANLFSPRALFGKLPVVFMRGAVQIGAVSLGQRAARWFWKSKLGDRRDLATEFANLFAGGQCRLIRWEEHTSQ